ncbi:MAG: flippase [Pseudanabaena sp. CAN_BIN31]|nr:flippase [Pseudanabaena sp. CAN_BIN31]
MQTSDRHIPSKVGKGFKKILGNISWLFAERIFSMFISLFINVLVIRYLGPKNLGQLSYALSFVALVGVAAKLGLDGIVVRNIVQKQDSAPEILGTAFTLKFIASIITIAITFVLALFLNQDIQINYLILIVALTTLFNSLEVIEFWFRSQVIARPMVMIRTGILIFSSIAKLFLIQWKSSLELFAWLLLIESVLTAIAMLFVYKSSNHSIRKWKFNNIYAKDMLKDSFPLIFAAISVTIYMKIDQIMLANMSTSSEVGNYAAAIRFSEIWYFIPMFVCASIFPSIVRSKERGIYEYQIRIQQLYDLMGWLSWIIIIFMSLIGTSVVKALIGVEFDRAIPILLLHIWATPFVFLGVARSQWLMAENLTSLSFKTSILGATINIVLNYFLIPVYGGVGAAIATVISYGVQSHFSCILFKEMHQQFSLLMNGLFVPFRINQNIIYFRSIIKLI